MIRRRQAPQKQMEMVSLTDVIFLLLIFGLLQAFGELESISTGPRISMTITLEEVRAAGNHKEQMVRFKDPASNTSDSAVYRIDESFYGLDSASFALLPANTFLATAIGTFLKKGKEKNILEPVFVLADPHTPVRTIDFIIRQIGAYGEGMVQFVPTTGTGG